MSYPADREDGAVHTADACGSPTTETLRCSACLEEKAVSEFIRDTSHRRGFSYSCKACKRAGRGSAVPRCNRPDMWRNQTTDAARRVWLEENSTPEPNTGCWLWLGRESRFGYGMVYTHRAPKGGCRYKHAHRLSVEAFHGPIPDGIDVCHTCDTPGCINPAHLFLGDVSTNLRDCVKKERCGTAKITNAQAVEMRRLYAEGYGVNQLRLMFGLSKSATQQVIRRETWRDAEDAAA
jgi:hypothetical protein